MTDQDGLFTIPTRLYLTADQRAKLQQLVREQHTDLSAIVTRMVAERLDALPDVELPSTSPKPDIAGELRARRAELRRLIARRDQQGGAGPAWLNGYINELEAEIRQLENQR